MSSWVCLPYHHLHLPSPRTCYWTHSPACTEHHLYPFRGIYFIGKIPPPTLPTLYQECNLRGFLLTWGENPNYFWVNNKHFQKSPKQICPKFISSKNSIHPKGWNKYVKILILNQDQIIVLNLFWVKDKFHMDKICDRTITR